MDLCADFETVFGAVEVVRQRACVVYQHIEPRGGGQNFVRAAMNVVEVGEVGERRSEPSVRHRVSNLSAGGLGTGPVAANDPDLTAESGEHAAGAESETTGATRDERDATGHIAWGTCIPREQLAARC